MNAVEFNTEDELGLVRMFSFCYGGQFESHLAKLSRLPSPPSCILCKATGGDFDCELQSNIELLVAPSSQFLHSFTCLCRSRFMCVQSPVSIS